MVGSVDLVAASDVDVYEYDADVSLAVSAKVEQYRVYLPRGAVGQSTDSSMVFFVSRGDGISGGDIVGSRVQCAVFQGKHGHLRKVL
jgi:hypothetical protein